MTQTQKRFLRMKSGAVYNYSDTLAKRRDALEVDGYAAAEYFRAIGVKNDITEAYPVREGSTPTKLKQGISRRPSRKSKVVVSDEETPNELEELIGKDGENLL